MWTSTPAGCLIGDNCNSDVGGEPDALKGASPVRRGAEGRSLRDATRPTLRLPERFHIAPEPQPEVERIASAEAFFERIPATVNHGGDRAYYMPSADRIQLPPFTAFHDAHSYYATRGHETVHWTRHESRLDRRFGREKWGDEGYAREELVALSGQSAPCLTLH